MRSKRAVYLDLLGITNLSWTPSPERPDAKVFNTYIVHGLD